MVNKNKNLVFSAFELVLLDFKYFHNSQKLTVISFIASFSQNYFLKKIGY